MSWQPIETAPAGEIIELWHSVWLVPVAAHFDDSVVAAPWVEATRTTRWPAEAFSHWRPRSEPPAEQSSGRVR
jgi:hypothetical protein